MNFDTLVAALKVDEGLRLKPYLDTAIPPRITIGYGRNLSDTGISIEEASSMLATDTIHAARDAAKLLANWDDLGDVRRNVIVNMTFNMGRARLGNFKKMLAAIESLNFDEAAREMLASKWASQVGGRAQRLATEMRTGIAL